MPDQNIDLRCPVTLPTVSNRVYVQLRESRPERVFYRVNLKNREGVVSQVAPPATYDIPVRHDLGHGANELSGCHLACDGIVGFVAAGKWQLRFEIFVAGELVATCGPGQLDGAPGEMARFRFICDFA